MENPYGHDRWCNLMTAHSGAGGRRKRKGVGEATGGGVDRRRGGWSGRMGDGVWRGAEGLVDDLLSSGLAGWC